jgi:RecA-family ATPase
VTGERFESVDVSTFDPPTLAREWLRSAGDLLAGDDPGPTPWLVDDLIVDGAIFAIQGAGKVGKTWTILELARAIVTGVPAFGRFTVPDPGPVIVLLEESGERALHRRLDALMRGNAQVPEDFDHLYYGANLGIKLDEERWRERLLAAARELHPRAVFLDPLVRMKGARDENSQAEMIPVLDTVLALRQESGTAPGFAHHTGHNGKHLRGSSDLEAFWESKLTVTKTDDGSRRITSEHREAESGSAWSYRLGWDQETRSLRLRAGDDQKRKEVADYLREHPEASGNEVFKTVGGTRSDVLALVKELREQQTLEGLE